MPQVKVKTLNRGDILIDFGNQMTILNLKDEITKKLNLPPNTNQRLIYCGRILENEKKIKDYDLDGKVIHMVQNAPDLTSNMHDRNSTQNSNQPESTGFNIFNRFNSETTNTENGSSHIIDINLNGTFVHSEAENRLMCITRILGCINQTLDQLENPNLRSSQVQPATRSLQFQPATRSSQFQPSFRSPTVEQTAEITARATTTSLSDFFQNLTNSFTQIGFFPVNDGSNNNSRQSNVSVNQINVDVTEISLDNLNQTLNRLSSLRNEPNQSDANLNENQQNESNSRNTSNENNSNENQSNQLEPSYRNLRVTWSEFSELLLSVKEAQERFNPHYTAFQASLTRENFLNPDRTEEAQERFRLVSRLMHHISHVYHLLSEFYINYTHQQDRTVQIYGRVTLPILYLPTSQITNNINRTSNTRTSSENISNPSTANNSTQASSVNTGGQQNPIPQTRPRIGHYNFSNLSLERNPSQQNNSLNSTHVIIQTFPHSQSRTTPAYISSNQNNSSNNQQQFQQFSRVLQFPPLTIPYSSNQQLRVNPISNGRSGPMINLSSDSSNSSSNRSNTRTVPIISMSSDRSNTGLPHTSNFDPYLPCSSHWVMTESIGRSGLDLAESSSSNQNNTNATTNTSTENSQEETNQGPSTSSTQSLTTSSEIHNLFECLNELFYYFFWKEYLSDQISNLPRGTNISLAKFINTLQVFSIQESSNAIFELFMIIAKSINVTEFLRLMLFQEYDCLDRARNDLYDFVKVSMFNNSVDPFDISEQVQMIVSGWEPILHSLFSEVQIQFSQRSFKALLLELTTHLCLIFRLFIVCLGSPKSENEESESFGSLFYGALKQLFVDFHSSLTEMFGSVNIVNTILNNILKYIFPEANFLRLVQGIVKYIIPGFVVYLQECTNYYSNYPRTKNNFLRNRLLSMEVNDAIENPDLNENSNLNFINNVKASSSNVLNIDTSNSSNQPSSSKSIFNSNNSCSNSTNSSFLNYGSQDWHSQLPRNWINIITYDQLQTNRPRSSNDFSSIYKQDNAIHTSC